MRQAVDRGRLQEFMRLLAAAAREPGRIYLVGGASAVLQGWRGSTVDIDLKIIPEHDRLLRAIPEIKERLQINVELAAPSDFVPPLPGWEDRSPLIARQAPLDFHHFDFYCQCLAKLERAHRKDLADVEAMLGAGLVDPDRLRQLFARVEEDLYRYPAVDPAALKRVVEALQRP
jgi:hypothetical protein